MSAAYVVAAGDGLKGAARVAVHMSFQGAVAKGRKAGLEQIAKGSVGYVLRNGQRKLATKAGEQLATKVAKAAAKASLETVLKDGAVVVLKGSSKACAKKATATITKQVGAEASKKIVKDVTKKATKGAVKKMGAVVPGISLGIASGAIIYRLTTQSIKSPKTWVNICLDATSGVAGCFPGVGTGIAIACDAANTMVDVGADVNDNLEKER